MTSPALRGTAARRAAPPPTLPNTDNLDGLPGVGLDSTDDLMDTLIAEAGEADEIAILDTGLPDDYDPSGGMESLGGGGGAAGRVFRLDGEEAEPATSSTGTRVGVLPKRQAIATEVVSKFSGVATPAPKPPPPPQDLPDEEEGLDETEEPLGVEEEDSYDDLPPEPAAVETATTALAADDDVDADLMAELAGGARAVSSAAASDPCPASLAGQSASQVPSEPSPAAAPEVPEPPEGEFPEMASHLLPVPGLRREPIIVSKWDVLPMARPWIYPLENGDGEAFESVLHDLGTDLYADVGTLLPIHGSTHRHRAMQTVIEAVQERPLSTSHHVYYRSAGVPVFLFVSSRLYTSGGKSGLLLVEASREGAGVHVRALTLFDPSLLIAS